MRLVAFIFPICWKEVPTPVIGEDFLNRGALGENRMGSLFFVVLSMPTEASFSVALGAHCKNLATGLFI